MKPKSTDLGSDGRKWVWKKPGENLSDRLVKGTKKFGGGSLMVWECMLWDGTGYACKIDGKMDGDLYVKILEEDLQESVNYFGKSPGDVIFQSNNDSYFDKSPDDGMFQQDNDSKHTCKKAQAWFQDHDFKVLLWPAQSPDLNCELQAVPQVLHTYQTWVVRMPGVFRGWGASPVLLYTINRQPHV